VQILNIRDENDLLGAERADLRRAEECVEVETVTSTAMLGKSKVAEAPVIMIVSVVLDPGQTRPSACRVSAGQKVNGLTDPSVERVKQVLDLTAWSELTTKVVLAYVVLIWA
jgi:hypothetical protein